MDMNFSRIQQSKQQFANHYESNHCFLTRFLVQSQTLSSIYHTRQKIKQHYQKNPNQPINLQVEQVKNIMYEDSALYMGQQFGDYLQKLYQSDKDHQINVWDIYQMIYQSHLKTKIFLVFILFLAQASLKLAFSFILQYLFNSVADGQKSKAYGFALMAGFCWYLSIVCRHNALYQTPIVGARIKAGLISVLFAKLSSLSHFTIKNSQTSKVVNIFSNDFNIIEAKNLIFFNTLITPFVFIGVTIILIVRFGWPGIIGIIMPILFLPIQNLISKKNGELLQKVNFNKDQRLRVSVQIIEGIKFIKLYGWQLAFKKMIQKYRKKEIRIYIWLYLGKSLQKTMGNCVAVWSALLMFVIEHYASGSLSTAMIFSILELMVVLRFNILFFSLGIGFIYELKIIFQRFANILNIKNIQMIQIDPLTKQPLTKETSLFLQKSSIFNESMLSISNEKINVDSSNVKFMTTTDLANDLQDGEILFQNFNGYWSTNDFTKPSIININIKFIKGNFYGVCGKIGSGKTSLLGAILNEIPFYSGTYLKKGQLVYVEQQPIIFSASVKENILFGKPFNQQRYDYSLNNSCLQADLQLLEKGDNTLIGERGTTLSGGQKVRLTLARALYANGDIYLLDDPISAVDAKVAKEIYEKAILQLSKEKTVILVTHQINYLLECDQVLILDNGQVIHYDKPQNLTKEFEELSRFEKKNYEEQDEEERKLKEEIAEEMRNFQIEIMKKKKDEMQSQNAKSEMDVIETNQINREESVQVTLNTYRNYILISKHNWLVFPITIIFFVANEVINTFYMRFLAQYDSQKAQSDTFFSDFSIYWIVLGLMQFFYFIIMVIKYFLLSIVVLNSNEKLHKQMIHSLVSCPSSYFDITPTGRLINKFSNDLGILDNTMVFVFTDIIEGPITNLIMLTNIFQINMLFIPLGAVTIIFLVFFFIYCKQAIIESKKMDLRTKTPAYNIFCQMILGLVQIRIFDRKTSLLKSFTNAVNKMTRAGLCYNNCSKGFGAGVSYFSIAVLIVGFIIGIYNSTIETAGLYGVSVVFMVQINDQLQFFLRQIIAMESVMVSVQRIKLLIDEKPEKQLRTEYDSTIGLQAQIEQDKKLMRNENFSKTIELSWPEKSSIEFKNVSMRYREGLPLALKNLSFLIQPGEKVGIVGRTGAGKSSIIQLMFRICESEPQSQYFFGGHEAKNMGLHSLRQHMSVIPQTPFIFRGTIRQNIDPFNMKNDEEIWQALQESNMAESIKSFEKKLDTEISNASQIFSVGQRQLLCMARVLLRKANKFLVLDEATSNVDMRTDQLIQKILKTKFKDYTVITIAHRLNTVADYDKIIVMHRGRVVEIGEPYELILKRGKFFEMVNNTGKNADIIKRVAKQNHVRKTGNFKLFRCISL